jgi:tetratricopeptide (TPR) repeat protein
MVPAALLGFAAVVFFLVIARGGARRPARVRDAFARSYELSREGRWREALEAIDTVDTRRLNPYGMALWLNNRAYYLAQLARSDEALRQLDQAEPLIDREEPEHKRLYACIVGTRGIALHLGGRHDEAELELRRALAISDAIPESAHEQIVAQERSLAGERWWWLAEIARARGDAAAENAALQRSASFDGRFAERARERLAGGAGSR